MGLNEKFFKSAAAAVDTPNFAPVIYTGNGGTQSISTVGFQPDLVWIKARTNAGYYHTVFDSVRGALKRIFTNESIAEITTANTLTSFDTNGFTLGNQVGQNGNNEPFVAWCWKAAGAANTFNVLEGGTVTSDSTASGAGITAGTITSGWEVSANRDAGFSIVKYSGTNTVSDTVGHGLSQAPELVIVKNISAAKSWAVRHVNLASTQNLFLNASVAATTITLTANGGVGVINNTTVGFASGGTNASNVNISGNDFIAYCFHSVAGYQKVGSYTGDGSSNKSYVINVGFQPRFVMIKNTQSAGTSWVMADNLRGFADLYANTSDAEFSSSDLYGAHFTSVGFTFNTADVSRNKLNEVYIYLAIA